jgi:flagellar L-ring protein precursor FlgH
MTGTTWMRQGWPLALVAALAACQRLEGVGKAPAFSPVESGGEYHAMTTPGLPDSPEPGYASAATS